MTYAMYSPCNYHYHDSKSVRPCVVVQNRGLCIHPGCEASSCERKVGWGSLTDIISTRNNETHRVRDTLCTVVSDRLWNRKRRIHSFLQ